MPPREKSPESLNSQKRLYSDNRGRGSRTTSTTTSTTTTTTTRTPKLTSRSARLRRQIKSGINSNRFDPFLEFFFHGSPKKWPKLKLYSKIRKYEQNFQIL